MRICVEQEKWLLVVLEALVSLPSDEAHTELARVLDGVGFAKLEGVDPQLFLSRGRVQDWFDAHPDIAAVIVNNPEKILFGDTTALHPWIPFVRCREGLSGSTSRSVAFWFALIFDFGLEIVKNSQES